MRVLVSLIFAFALAAPVHAQTDAHPAAPPPARVIELVPADHADAQVNGVVGQAPAYPVNPRYAQPSPPIYSMSNAQSAQEAAREAAGVGAEPPTLAEIDRQFGTHYAADAARAAAQSATQTMLFSYAADIYTFGGIAYGLLVFLVSFLLIWRALVRWIGKNGVLFGFFPAAMAAFVLAAGTALAWPLLILAPLLFIGAGNNVLADQIKAVIDAAKPGAAGSGERS